MNPEVSQKTTCLYFVGGLALVMAAGLVMQLSSDHPSGLPTVEAANEMYPAPAAQEAAPVPAPPDVAPDEGVDASTEDEPLELPSI